MSRVLITGGAGFVGSHLAEALHNAGHSVDVLDNFSTGKRENLNFLYRAKRPFLFDNSITNKDRVEWIGNNYQFDYIFHLAAQINVRKSIENPHFDASTNILGSLNILNLAVKMKAHLIFSSTGGAIYSPDETMPYVEESKCDPKSPYGLSKFSTENYIKLYASLYGLKYTILRYANVYGPRQNAHGEAGVVAIFMDKIKSKQSCTIFGDGDQTRDFVFVDDVVKANMNVMSEEENNIYNIGTGCKTSVNKVWELVKKEFKLTSDPAYAPKIEGEMYESYLDATKYLSKYQESFVGVEEGIARTAKYLSSGG